MATRFADCVEDVYVLQLQTAKLQVTPPQVAEQKEIENIPSFYIIRMTIRITKITPQPNASEVSLNGAREAPLNRASEVSLDWDDIVGESLSACYEKENAK